jgi:hypothetical protein
MEGDVDKCIICLEEIQPNNNEYEMCAILQTCTCLYKAHIDCIGHWVHQNQTCPICHETCIIGYRQSYIKRKKKSKFCCIM